MENLYSRKIVETIFQYNDYRAFLNDFFRAKKMERRSFSQRNFAKKTGFKAHNFCTLVMNGSRNLSASSIQKLIRGLGLRGKSATFFENLVNLNQATTPADKEYFYQRIKRVGKTAEFFQVDKEQYFFYEKWYYPVVRELMVLADWKNDYSQLARMVRPPIHPAEAQRAVELLLETNMVSKSADGRFHHNHEFVTSQSVPALIKAKARRDVLLKGIETIDSIDPLQKYAAYSTVAMSTRLYGEVRAMLDEVREKILSMVAEDTALDEIYEVVFQVFPVSSMSKNVAAAPKKAGRE
jgi:uncharacterized protein (TIGR02147 family)